jgi:ubiquinone/menaquinone biosynthesis C-methylase UbiE
MDSGTRRGDVDMAEGDEIWINPGGLVHLDDDRKALYEAVSRTIEGMRVLDIGCGAGVLEFYYDLEERAYTHLTEGKRSLYLLGIDIDGYAIELAREARREHLRMDMFFEGGNALRLQYPEENFDCVILSEVLEHLHDWETAYMEAWRVLRTGGRLIITVPDGLRVSDPEHMHLFSKESWEHIKDKVWLETPRKWIGFYVEKKEVLSED